MRPKTFICVVTKATICGPHRRIFTQLFTCDGRRRRVRNLPRAWHKYGEYVFVGSIPGIRVHCWFLISLSPKKFPGWLVFVKCSTTRVRTSRTAKRDCQRKKRNAMDFFHSSKLIFLLCQLLFLGRSSFSSPWRRRGVFFWCLIDAHGLLVKAACKSSYQLLICQPSEIVAVGKLIYCQRPSTFVESFSSRQENRVWLQNAREPDFEHGTRISPRTRPFVLHLLSIIFQRAMLLCAFPP